MSTQSCLCECVHVPRATGALSTDGDTGDGPTRHKAYAALALLPVVGREVSHCFYFVL